MSHVTCDWLKFLQIQDSVLRIQHLPSYPILQLKHSVSIAMSKFQSNRPFSSTSNFYPSPPVRYRIHSLFPTMSQEESRLLWFFLEGDPKPYDIFDIPLNANVNHLKTMIKEKIESLHEINAYCLRLMKVTLIPEWMLSDFLTFYLSSMHWLPSTQIIVLHKD